MTEELQELYKEVIFDHNKNPRNYGFLEIANKKAEGHNPLCGDHFNVEILVDDDNVIKDIKFHGAGCAISKASASIMTTILKGKTVEEAKDLFDKFRKIVTEEGDGSEDELNLGKLAVFCGVREFPTRVKCASLAWNTMYHALEEKAEAAKTE